MWGIFSFSFESFYRIFEIAIYIYLFIKFFITIIIYRTIFLVSSSLNILLCLLVFLIVSFIYACIWALFLKINLFGFGTSPHKRCLLLSPFSTRRMQETVLYLLCVVLKINYFEMYQFITQWCHLMFSVFQC